MKLEQVEQIFKELQYTWGLPEYRLEFVKYLPNGVHMRSHILGYCSCRDKVIGLNRNFVLVNDEKIVKETLSHEVAHALTDDRGYCGDGHNEEWKDMCRLVGAIPQQHPCLKSYLHPISIFGWVGLSKFLAKFYDVKCNCFKCKYGIYEY